MEGVRRIDERGRLSEVFPDLDMVVEAVANPERVKHSVTLTQEEWQVFFLVDGRRSLSEICRLAGNPDELATLQILHNLLTAKFVARGARQRRRRRGAPRGRATPRARARRQGPAQPRPAARARVGGVQPGVRSPAKLEDDTKEVVQPQGAVQYWPRPAKVTVSRLVIMQGRAARPRSR